MPFDIAEFPLPAEAKEANPLLEAARVLFTAADIVRQRGLAKFDREDDRGRVCVHGAIALAAGGRPWDIHDRQLTKHMALYLRAQGVDRHIAPLNKITIWNDAAERTEAEVIAALEGCALALQYRAQETGGGR